MENYRYRNSVTTQLTPPPFNKIVQHNPTPHLFLFVQPTMFSTPRSLSAQPSASTTASARKSAPTPRAAVSRTAGGPRPDTSRKQRTVASDPFASTSTSENSSNADVKTEEPPEPENEPCTPVAPLISRFGFVRSSGVSPSGTGTSTSGRVSSLASHAARMQANVNRLGRIYAPAGRTPRPRLQSRVSSIRVRSLSRAFSLCVLPVPRFCPLLLILWQPSELEILKRKLMTNAVVITSLENTLAAVQEENRVLSKYLGLD